MLEQITTNVFAWSELHGMCGRQYPWNSFAIRFRAAGVLALIDPLEASKDVIDALEAVGPPTHVFLTCNWHLRNAESYRSIWGCEIHVHESGLEGAATAIDGVFKDGDEFWSTLKVVHLPGLSSWPEESAFLVAEDCGTLITGDAFCGGRADSGVAEGTVGKHEPSYCFADPSQTHDSVRKILALRFHRLCFGHGLPILFGAKQEFKRFIAQDAVLDPDRRGS